MIKSIVGVLFGSDAVAKAILDHAAKGGWAALGMGLTVGTHVLGMSVLVQSISNFIKSI